MSLSQAVVRLRAYAKVNYALEVGGLRPDGYHEIRTVIQSVSLFDELEVQPAETEVLELLVEPGGFEVGDPEENTVRRAWSLLQSLSGRSLGARIRLRKGIPPGSGLGGASADAAATLVGLDEAFGLGLGTAGAQELGSRIGADVPFCVLGGTALAEGIGEKLTSLPPAPGHRLVLAKPGRGVSTAAIYGGYDRLPVPGERCVEPVVAALESGDLERLGRAVDNDLAPVTNSLVPEVEEYEQRLRDHHALGASMTGSGTAVYGVFGSGSAAEEAETRVGASFHGVYEPLDYGIERTTAGDRETR